MQINKMTAAKINFKGWPISIMQSTRFAQVWHCSVLEATTYQTFVLSVARCIWFNILNRQHSSIRGLLRGISVNSFRNMLLYSFIGRYLEWWIMNSAVSIISKPEVCMNIQAVEFHCTKQINARIRLNDMFED